MATLEARRLELLAQLEAAPLPMPRLHPNLAELYRQKVINLAEALNDEHTCLEAAECLRELIEEIRLVPEKGKLRIELYGELAALLNLANGRWLRGGRIWSQAAIAGQLPRGLAACSIPLPLRARADDAAKAAKPT